MAYQTAPATRATTCNHAISWCRSHADRATERAVLMPRSTEGKTPQKTPESSTPRPYMGYVSSQWHTRRSQAPQQLPAIRWCRSHACRATERAVLMPRSTEGKTPRKTPESSAPRPYIGYVSSQWHTRQPQAPPQLAAISWCRSHACRATERAVSMPRSTEGKTPEKRQNRVPRGRI